jgi:hypothetical protein
MKNTAFFVMVLVLLALCPGGCGGSKANVTLGELVANPDQYSGKTVTVDGVYVNGWGSTVLADDIKYTAVGELKELNIVGNSIWFSGFLPQNVRDKLYAHTSPGAGPEHFAKVRVTGLFETEGNYGNMNQFKYRITVNKTKLLDWTPPE